LDPYSAVQIPDRAPLDILHNHPSLLKLIANSGLDINAIIKDLDFPIFSMASGDLVDIYGKDESFNASFDAVVTCFFIDTAPVVIE
jgi:hypothetical protein